MLNDDGYPGDDHVDNMPHDEEHNIASDPNNDSGGEEETLSQVIRRKERNLKLAKEKRKQ